MAEVPEQVLARRAARAAQRRRQRRLALGAAVSAFVALGAVIGLLVTGSRPPHRRVPRLATARPARQHARHIRLSAATVLEQRGIARIRHLAGLGLPLYCGGSHGRALAFTFDDGPGPYTHLALHKLSAAHERATFFVVGRSIRNFPGSIERETAVAAIGDHTMTHPYLPALPAAAVDAQLARPQAMVQAALHRPVVLFRPPYGARDPTVDAAARRLGMLEVLWSVDSRDSLGANWARIIRNVEAGMRPGAIILMHENRGQTIRALTTLLPALRRRHLRSVSLPELLATDSPSVAQLRAGEGACGLGSLVSTGS
jgi:peptidoglycan/xylan/chitin deacetylase (PgdA/CDA1 family)